MKDQVSVVILNWNGREMLRRFLPSVVLFSAGATVCVADNGSTDDSCELIAADFPSVKLLRLGANYGFAEGYNRALTQVNTPYAVLLNSDVEVTAGWLNTLCQYLEAHKEAAACQPKVRSYARPELFEYAGAAGGFLDRWGYPYCRGRLINHLEKDEGQYDAVAPVFWATGAALMIRTAVYKEAGGFDARFFAHQEEIDLCWRLRSRGYQIVCVPASVVYHVGGGTLAANNPRKTFLNFRNNLWLLYKNLPDGELRRVMRVRWLLDGLAALRFLLSGEGAHALAVLKARRAFRKSRQSLLTDRERNLAATVQTDIPERTRKSLLVACYLKRQRTFTAFHND